MALRKRLHDSNDKCEELEKEVKTLKAENEKLRTEMKSIESRIQAARAAQPPPTYEKVAPAAAKPVLHPPHQDGVVYPPPALNINNENRDIILQNFPVLERLDSLLDLFDPVADNEVGREIWNLLRAAHRDIRNHAFCGELYPIDPAVVSQFVESLKESDKPFQHPCLPSFSTDNCWIPKQALLLIYGQKDSKSE